MSEWLRRFVGSYAEDRLADQHSAENWRLENGEEKMIDSRLQVLSDAYNRHRQRRNKRNYNP